MEVATSDVAWGVPSVERSADNLRQLIVKATVKYSNLQEFLHLAQMTEPNAEDTKGQALFEYKSEAKKLHDACTKFRVNLDDLVAQERGHRHDTATR